MSPNARSSYPMDMKMILPSDKGDVLGGALGVRERRLARAGPTDLPQVLRLHKPQAHAVIGPLAKAPVSTPACRRGLPVLI